MEAVPSLLIVGASYASYLLAWRRIRVIHGRRRGPELDVFAAYDHRGLARELAPLLEGIPPGQGEQLVSVPLDPHHGSLPEPWASAPWSFAGSPDAPARDRLLAGETDVAGPPALFAWACLVHLFAGSFERAAAIAKAAPDRTLSLRLLAQVEARRVELLPRGPARDAACAAARSHLRGLPDPSPLVAGLDAHLAILQLSLWNLEASELSIRRHLRRALDRNPAEPALHLERAHLAAALGDGPGAADHLARALYYARGDAFYARPILASPYVARVRPALAAQARALVGPSARLTPPEGAP